MPVMYANYYGILIDAARDCGYALALHGSVTRDLDLLAVPWVENPKRIRHLLSVFVKILGGIQSVDEIIADEGLKPHGRKAYTILTDGGGFIDLSVMPILN